MTLSALDEQITTSTLIFLHIPRTAGKTLIRILEKRFNTGHVYNFNIKDEKVSPGWDGNFYDPYQRRLNILAGLPVEKRTNFKFIHGHIIFGVHKYLSNPASYITLMRDPVDRMVSVYYYLLQRAGSWLYEKAQNSEVDIENLSHLEYFIEKHLHLPNFQTMVISGDSGGKGMLEQAKENLDKFAVVGLMERFDETLLLMKKVLGWESFPYYEKVNAAVRRPKRSEIPQHIVQMIEEYDKLDCELYNYAKKRFDEKMQLEIFPMLGKDELHSLQNDNEGRIKLFILQNKLNRCEEEIFRSKEATRRSKAEVVNQRERAEKFKTKISRLKAEVVNQRERAEKFKRKMTELKRCTGLTIWLTGLSGAGKSTIAQKLASALRKQECKVEVLDGDELRTSLTADLGFSREDRDKNVRRIGCVAGLLSRNGIIVIVAAISPYRMVRDEIRKQLGAFMEVYVKASIETCEHRDVKGLYKRTRAGEIENFTGINDPYEPPFNCEIICDTDVETVEESAAKVLEKVYELQLTKS